MLTKRLLKTANVMYLYGDGHAVVLHKKRDKDAGEVKWATLHETIGVAVRMERGRIIVHHQDSIALVLITKSLDARHPTPEGGSNKTREAGLKVGNLKFRFADGASLDLPLMPDFLGGDFTVQDENSSDWAYVMTHCTDRWCDYRVSYIYEKPKAPVVLAVVDGGQS